MTKMLQQQGSLRLGNLCFLPEPMKREWIIFTNGPLITVKKLTLFLHLNGGAGLPSIIYPYSKLDNTTEMSYI